jgi:hypothetical protein
VTEETGGWMTTIGGRSSAYAAMPTTNRIGITIGGTRYFMGRSVKKGLSLRAPTAVLGHRRGQRRSGSQHAYEDCHPNSEAA